MEILVNLGLIFLGLLLVAFYFFGIPVLLVALANHFYDKDISYWFGISVWLAVLLIAEKLSNIEVEE